MPIIDKAPIILQKKLQEEGYEVFKNGWPDFLAIKDGKLKFIEAKEHWDKLSKEQIKMMQVLTDNGLPCFVWYPHKGLIDFKDYLNHPIKEKKNSQSELAKKIGISRTYLNGILKNKRTPGIELAKRINKITGKDFFKMRPDIKKLIKELL